MKRIPIAIAKHSSHPHPCSRSISINNIPAPKNNNYSINNFNHHNNHKYNNYFLYSPASKTILGHPPKMAIFNFQCYSSSSPKSASTNTTNIRHCFIPGIFSLPHPNKIKKGGEDANFISSDYKVLAVADGVGGWGDVGVDPALYSRALMEGCKLYCAENIDVDPENFKQVYDPVTIMDAGYKFASKIVGSSTCCVCVLDGLKLRVANLGDSGFTIIRRGKVVFSSIPQQHAFNFPYQLGSQSDDLPEHAELFEKKLELGDIVIAASDGVFDNVSPDTIATLVDAEPKSTSVEIAERIGVYARSQADRRTGDTPFAIMAQNHGYDFKGGKLDDITVVVGIVSEDTSCINC